MALKSSSFYFSDFRFLKNNVILFFFYYIQRNIIILEHFIEKINVTFKAYQKLK